MGDRNEYRFLIDAYSPETIPMSRLAEYMANLARLLGRTDRVHFVRLDRGSTVLVQIVETEAEPEVRSRINSLTRGDAPKDAVDAFRALNRCLADDEASGSLRDGGGEVVRFPGYEQPRPPAFGAFNQASVLDGMLIRVGGRDDAVPVHLQDADTVHVCNANRDMAKLMAPCLFGPTLRVQGDGRWERDADGQWSMRRFTIKGFRELDDVPLGEAVKRLRGVEGNGWKDIEDPWTELERLRGHNGGR